MKGELDATGWNTKGEATGFWFAKAWATSETAAATTTILLFSPNASQKIFTCRSLAYFNSQLSQFL
jgi:hypothetical protein